MQQYVKDVCQILKHQSKIQITALSQHNLIERDLIT